MYTPQICPLCSHKLVKTSISAPNRLTGENQSSFFKIFSCPFCQIGLSDPQLTDKELTDYYPSSYYQEFYQGSKLFSNAESMAQRLRRGVRKINEQRYYQKKPWLYLKQRQPGRVLDVGCGQGKLLKFLESQGWQTYGLDPEKQEQRLQNIYHGSLADYPQPKELFDLVIFHHSLEHIPNPVAAIEKARSLLKPGGWLLVVVPNWQCWQKYLWRSYWAVLDLPRHQTHFSLPGLSKLAVDQGFTPLHRDTISNIISTSYSLHYRFSGRWQEGSFSLWSAYLLSLLLFPLIWVMDRFLGGDSCYLLGIKD